jgi:hypothetical protein
MLMIVDEYASESPLTDVGEGALVVSIFGGDV